MNERTTHTRGPTFTTEARFPHLELSRSRSGRHHLPRAPASPRSSAARGHPQAQHARVLCGEGRIVALHRLELSNELSGCHIVGVSQAHLFAKDRGGRSLKSGTWRPISVTVRVMVVVVVMAMTMVMVRGRVSSVYGRVIRYRRIS